MSGARLQRQADLGFRQRARSTPAGRAFAMQDSALRVRTWLGPLSKTARLARGLSARVSEPQGGKCWPCSARRSTAQRLCNARQRAARPHLDGPAEQDCTACARAERAAEDAAARSCFASRRALHQRALRLQCKIARCAVAPEQTSCVRLRGLRSGEARAGERAAGRQR
jgi:hypothetical protein